ncbi:hypothetical protein G4G27_09155 [Sphingomonas sp. So64.6b]|uniref:hypothetical protein n=1 Tax=Sphingomonas sp. So64.6b TaxID=2997354 RepID=UPI0015FFB640|nr:hypothetical protein [Sphingomonas sp. So64.6b]QNA84135.1 hypothetical protein G4G27_09155 [Sphingomonas sp. So64.6b]
MNSLKKLILGLAAVSVIAAPAIAGYKLMPAGVPIAVAKSGLTITPSVDWNRLGARPGRNAESWTLDGLTLNDVTFYGGIPNNTTLFKDAKKKTEPLPRFSSTMLIPDIAQLFESSYRVSVGTSLMTIDAVKPAIFAGSPGFHFTYSFVIQGEEVRRKGEAAGAVIGGNLYMITYEAPIIHYYDASIDLFNKLAETAVIRPVKK